MYIDFVYARLDEDALCRGRRGRGQRVLSEVNQFFDRSCLQPQFVRSKIHGQNKIRLYFQAPVIQSADLNLSASLFESVTIGL